MKLKPSTLRCIEDASIYHEDEYDIISMYNRRYSLNKIAFRSIRCFDTVENDRLVMRELRDILDMINDSSSSGIARLCKLYRINLEAGQSRIMYDVSDNVKFVDEFQDLVDYVYEMRSCNTLDDFVRLDQFSDNEPVEDQFDYLVACRLFLCLVVSLLMTRLYNQANEEQE